MHRHPYLFAIPFAVILAVAVWFVTPKEYAAFIKISDEQTETDLSIGLNPVLAEVNRSQVSGTDNLNGIEVYGKSLKTLDFAGFMAGVHLEGKDMTYGQWVMSGRHFWQTKDTLEVVSGKVDFNISSAQKTLTVQFTDCDPVVAAYMLDSAIAHLQQIVTESRHHDAYMAAETLRMECQSSETDYYRARDEYASYCDSHQSVRSQEALSKRAFLLNELDRIRDHYETVSLRYARQISLQARDYCSFAVVIPNTVPIHDTSHLSVYVIVFCLLSVLAVKGYKLMRLRLAENFSLEIGGLFSPWSVTAIVWGSMGVLLLLYRDLFDPVTEQFHIAIILWISIFTVTSFVSFNLLKHDTKPLSTSDIDVNRTVFNILFILMVLMCPMYLHRIWQTVSAFADGNIMKDIRRLAVYGNDYGLLNYSFVISQSLLLVSLWKYPKMPLWQLITVICCCFFNALAIMEKGFLFLIVLSGIYVLFERKVIRFRSLLCVVGALLVFFYFFNLIREGGDSIYADKDSFIDFIRMYVVSPPVAFCRVSQDVAEPFGANTFSAIYPYINHHFGTHFPIHPQVQEFVFVPISTNVYTVLQPFFRDFGYAGVTFFAWIYGMMAGVAYRYSRNGNSFCICIYTYLLYVLVLQFFQEYIFMSLVFVIRLFFLLFLLLQTKVRLKWA